MEGKTVDKKNALARIQYLCAKSEKCSGDVLKKCALWKLSPDDTAWVLKQLIADGFVSDERFARYYVRDKAQFNKWGRIKIKTYLRAKGIDAQIIELAMLDFPADTNNQTLGELLKRKLPNISAKSDYELKSKLIRFGVSRGFELDLVIVEANRLLKQSE